MTTYWVKDMDIEEAIKDGIDRTNEQTGYILIAVFFVISLISAIASQTQAAQAFGRMGQMSFLQDTPFGQFADPGPLPLAFEALPSALVSLMSIGSSIAFIIAAVVAYRVFAADARDQIPEEAYKRDIGMTTLNAIVASIIFGIVVAIGLILLIIPGIYLITALLFFMIFIAVEDESFMDSLKSSWELTEGKRLSVFLLLVALFVINIIVGIAGGIITSILGSASLALAEIVTLAIGAAVNVFSLAVLLSAYYQLRDSEGGETVTEADTGTTTEPGAGTGTGGDV